MATIVSPLETRAGCGRFREAETGMGITVLQDRRAKLARRNTMMSAADDAIGESADAARVGAELRQAREQLGWSLADVAANLRIRYVYLLALEEGRISDLPGIAYAVGFLRAYAKLLGLDPNAMSHRLRADVGADRKPELEFPAPVPDRGVPAAVVVLLGVVLAIGAYVGWYRMSGDRPGAPPVQAVPDRLATLTDPGPKPTGKPEAATGTSPAGRAVNTSAPAATSQPAAYSSVPPTSAAAAVLPQGIPAAQSTGMTGLSGSGMPAANASGVISGAAPTTAPNAENSHIVLRARSDTWVQVRERGGQVLLNRMLRSGETWQVPPANQQLLLTTGNAGGTELLVDGVVAPSLGQVGVVKRDLPLDATLIREGKLQGQLATSKAPGSPRP